VVKTAAAEVSFSEIIRARSIPFFVPIPEATAEDLKPGIE
jgi:hypothetical protein